MSSSYFSLFLAEATVTWCIVADSPPPSAGVGVLPIMGYKDSKVHGQASCPLNGFIKVVLLGPLQPYRLFLPLLCYEVQTLASTIWHIVCDKASPDYRGARKKGSKRCLLLIGAKQTNQVFLHFCYVGMLIQGKTNSKLSLFVVPKEQTQLSSYFLSSTLKVLNVLKCFSYSFFFGNGTRLLNKF